MLLVACLAPEAGCADRTTRATSSSPFEVKLSLGADEESFAAGAPIELVLSVRNTSGVPQRIALPSAQTHDFAVTDAGGRELWRWSAGRMFAQMLSELAFAPDEEKRFRASWDGRTAAGERASPGRYRARGWIAAARGEEVVATREFSIE